jgi:hypothetical protein
VGAGIQTLTIEVNAEVLTASLTVLPNETVNTPEDVFDTFYADYTTPEYIDFIDEVEFQVALDELRALPEPDRLIAAQMLANNRVILDNIAQVIANAEAETGLDFGKTETGGILFVIGAATAVIGVFLSAPIATAVGVGVLAGLVLKALKPVVKALWNKLVTGVTMALRLGYDGMSYITELVYDAGNQIIESKVEALPDTIFLENGSALKFAVKTVREPIISEENREEYAELGTFLDMYNRLQDFLAGTDYQIPSLETGEIADFALDLDNFSISVDNPVVDVSEITGTPELAAVSFDSPVDGAHIFNFTYTYVNDEGTETSFTQTARLMNISEYADWSGAGVSFSDTDSRSVIGSTVIIQSSGESQRYFNISLGNFWHVNDPAFTGVVRVNTVYFRIEDYEGPGTYTVVTGNFPDQGIMDVTMRCNAPYDSDQGAWLWSNTDYCLFSEAGYGAGYDATVTIADEEWIGNILVLEGNFNITMLNNGNSGGIGIPSSSCPAPTTFTGDFRIAAEDD